MRRVFRSWWFWTTLVVAILVALFLFGLPIFIQFMRPWWVRIAFSAAVVAIWLGIAFWRWRRARRANAAIAAELAKVDPANCNGCERCFADCPYAAIAMAPHPNGRSRIAVVDEDRCAACGICAGACPSSTPFRSVERLASGIDLPWLTIGSLRDEFDTTLARSVGSGAPLAVFSCQRGAGLGGGPSPCEPPSLPPLRRSRIITTASPMTTTSIGPKNGSASRRL